MFTLFKRSRKTLIFSLLLLVIFVYLTLILIPRPASVNLNSLTSTSFEIDVSASVYKVIDGDTFDAFPVGRVRLADINAPESGEPGYNEAKQALTNLVLGKTVYLDVDDIYVMDKYNRLVCVVYIKYNSTHLMNINFYLVINGYAVIEDYSNEFDPSTWKLYVHDPITISVKTDKINYLQGDIVSITGGVVSDSGPVSGVYINIEVDKPNGSLIFIDQVKTDNNGNFSTNFRLPLDAPLGKYNVTAVYGGISDYVQFEVVSQIIYTLADFPKPFVYPFLNTSFIIGGTHQHGMLNWGAWTVDVAGSIGVANKLGMVASGGEVAQYIDDDIADYNPDTKDVTIYWNKIKCKDIISVGSKAVNIITYKYENLIPFKWVLTEQGSGIHSELTGNTYSFSYGIDYAVISLIYDEQTGRYVMLIFGSAGQGSQAATLVLQYFENYQQLLNGKAIIIKWIDSNNNSMVDKEDSITLVERWE